MSNGATDKVALVGMATEAAAKDLQVPQLIEAGLIASASADEKSMQMYIALIRMAWDQLAGERPEAAGTSLHRGTVVQEIPTLLRQTTRPTPSGDP